MRAFGGRYDRKHPPILVLLLPQTCHQELCHCIGEAVKDVTALGMRGFGKSRVPGQGLYNKEERRWETERSMWHRHLPSWMAHPVLKETFSAKRCTLRDELTCAKTQCLCKRDLSHPSSAGQGCVTDYAVLSFHLTVLHCSSCNWNHLWFGTVATGAALGTRPATSRTEEGSCSCVLFKIWKKKAV